MVKSKLLLEKDHVQLYHLQFCLPVHLAIMMSKIFFINYVTDMTSQWKCSDIELCLYYFLG